MWTSAKTTFSTSIDSLVSTVTNSVSQFTSAAGKIGQGLIDGVVKALNDGASSVTNTILSIIQSGIDAVKNFFGIHSPSEVAAREIGAPLVAGIVSGLLSGAGDVAAAMGQVVGAGLIPARAYATMTPQQIASTSYVNTTYGGNTYQLNVNAMQSSGSIVRDFGIMQVMSGK
jgi:phage-related protein